MNEENVCRRYKYVCRLAVKLIRSRMRHVHGAAKEVLIWEVTVSDFVHAGLLSLLGIS